MKLRDEISYIESHAGDGDVVHCTMYRRRHIFETEGGLYWLIKKTAGVEGFRSLIDASHGVNENPDMYPFIPAKR